MSEGKREFTRVYFETAVRVSSGETEFISSRMRNVSLGGMLVETQEVIPQGAECLVSIELIGPRSLLKIAVEAEVVRVQEGNMALRFTKIDADSLIHLRHFIRIHADDADVIDDEYFRKLLQVEQADEAQ